MPLEELSFENLQRLSVRLLTASKATIQCQEYGQPGEKQEGIDIYARFNGGEKIEVWQCKRYKKLSAVNIRDAVAEFKRGKLLKITSRFILVTSSATESRSLADAEIAAANALRRSKVEFSLLGKTQLTTKLKDYPRIVDDFFGRYWVGVCCGEEAAETLGQRLSAEQVAQYRIKLRALYAGLFEQADSFLARSITTPGDQTSILPLPLRWVMPTVACRSNALTSPVLEEGQIGIEGNHEQITTELDPRHSTTTSSTIITETSAEAFLASTDRGVILGDPGHGKSALLRVLALDLLSEAPSILGTAERFGIRLPVWLPFAFVSTRVAAGDSVADAGAAWIKKNGGDETLAKLLAQAITEDRLLLLVDGLDEWSDPDRARETIIALQGFLSQTKAACFATARPLGYERLDRLAGDWKHGKLQPLSREQQHAVALVVFNGVRNSVAEDACHIEVERFSRQLQGNQSLREMASTPLLLVGMVSLWIRNQILPDSRLDVCEALVKEMLEDHPSKRAAISAPISGFSSISPQVRRAALASLAWSIHSSVEGAYLERVECEKCFSDFFERSEGFTPSAAKSHARQMLPISDQIIGVLSEASPGGDIQFVHRTFQELLAAEHLSSLPIQEQVKHCSNKAADPAWQQVHLFLFQKSNRPVETDALIEPLLRQRLKCRDEIQVKRLLSEAIFSPIRMTPEFRVKIADQILDEIESGAWLPLREMLLRTVLSAQRGSNVYSKLIERLKVWTPNPYDHFLYDALCEWPEETGAEAALWSLLNHQDVYVQVRTARALARRCKGNPAWAKRLLDRLHEPLSCNGSGAVLLALAEGWSSHEGAIVAFKRGLEAKVPEIVLPSILGLVRLGIHDEHCRDVLLLYGDTISFAEVATAAALEGWPRDEIIKQAAILRISDGYHLRDRAFCRDSAWKIAVEGYPGDGDVANVIAKEIARDSVNFSYQVDIEKMLRAFSGHPSIVSACELYLSKSNKIGSWIYPQIAGLAGTDASKKVLIECCLKEGVAAAHALRCLIIVWGENDFDVDILIKALQDNPPRIETFAGLVVELGINTPDTRRKLLDSLENGALSTFEFSAIIRALRTLRTKTPDNEVIERAWRFFENSPGLLRSAFGGYSLIDGFGDHPKVRGLALESMQDTECSWSTLAHVYRDDIYIRERVIELCRRLPDSLRLLIAAFSRQRSSGDPEFRAIAESFRREVHPDVRTLGAIAVAEATIADGESSLSLSEYFKSELTASGFDSDARVQSGLAGLISLSDFTLIRQMWSEGEARAKIKFPYSDTRWNVMPRFLVRNWQKLKTVFGGLLYDAFDANMDLVLVRDVAEEIGFPDVASEVSSVLRNRTRDAQESLESLAKDRQPGWIDACLSALGLVEEEIPMNLAYSDRHEASRLLASNGSGDDSIRSRLEGYVRNGHRWEDCALETLARGWVQSPVLKELWISHSESTENQEHLDAKLVATCASPDEFVTWLKFWFTKNAEGEKSWDFANERWFVIRRCFSDEDVAQRLLEQLRESDSTSVWVSYPWLIRSNSLPNAERELRDWADRKWLETAEMDWCLFGFDVFKNQHVPLKESLLDLLVTDQQYILP